MLFGPFGWKEGLSFPVPMGECKPCGFLLKPGSDALLNSWLNITFTFYVFSPIFSVHSFANIAASAILPSGNSYRRMEGEKTTKPSPVDNLCQGKDWLLFHWAHHGLQGGSKGQKQSQPPDR